MSKSRPLPLDIDHEPTEQERKDLITEALNHENMFIYQKDGDGYECFCFQCQEYFHVDKTTFKQARSAKVCPKCYRWVQTHTRKEYMSRQYICLPRKYGYRIGMKWKWGEEIRFDIKQVLYWYQDDRFRRAIAYGMGYHLCDTEDTGWRYIKSGRYGYYTDYSGFFWSTNTVCRGPLTRKQYYEKICFNVPLKSNQAKLIQSGIFGGIHVRYIVAFDLKTAEEVMRYSTYMKKNGFCNDNYALKLNVFYLDYLKRNNIPLHDFLDYKNDCERLGFKLDKPKDFQHRHEVVAEMVTDANDKKYEAGIAKQFKKLSQIAYRKDDVEILPFESARDMRNCGKRLHNCIGTYVQRYAKGETDLFYVTRNGVIEAAIEVHENRLRQARSDHNRTCPEDLQKIIDKWCDTHSIERKLAWY